MIPIPCDTSDDAMHALKTLARTLLLALLLAPLAGCEGLVTGDQAVTHALTPNDDGSFGPVKLELTPEMNPVAVNFKGSTIAHPNESSRWNTYAARLSRDGTTIASANVTINNTGTRDNDHGGPFAHTLFFVTVPEAGDYELTLDLARPKEITIEAPTIEIRRNTQPAPK